MQQFGSRKQPSPTSDGFSNPRALTFGDGYIWADGGNAVVQFNPDGSFVNRFGSKGNGNAQFKSGPEDLKVDPVAEPGLRGRHRQLPHPRSSTTAATRSTS